MTAAAKASGRLGAWAAGLLLAGFALRAGYLLQVRAGLPPYDASLERVDPDGYYRMSASLLETGTLARDGKPSSEREPGYSLLLAGASLWLGRTPDSGLFLNLLMGLASCWLLGAAAAKAFESPLAGLLALGASALYPEWVYYGAFLYRENLIVFLLALWAWLWAGIGDKPSSGRYAAMGAVYGALALTRAPMVPLAAVFLPLAARRLKPGAWPATLGLFLLGGLLLQAPWAWRNYRLTGRFVPGSSMGGSVMYFSLLKDYDRPDIPFEAVLRGDDPVIAEVRRRGLTMTEAEPLYYKACWDMLVHEPARFWGAFLRKVLKLWRPYPHAGWSYGHSYGLLQAVGLVSNGGLCLLGLAGAGLALRRGVDAGFWLMLPLVMSLIYGLFWAVTRYRSPLMVGVIPLAAYAAAAGLERARRRS